MASAVGSITRAATRRDGEPLNVLTFPTHERYETGLAMTGHIFWAVRGAPGVKDWNRKYAPVPSNYILLNPTSQEQQIHTTVDFDVILSQHKFGQFQLAHQLSSQLHLPIISLEHTLPVPQWGESRLAALKSMRGQLNVFISEFSLGKWRWDAQDPSVRVVHHGVDTNVFSPPFTTTRTPHLLSVVNDWQNRDWCMPAGQKLLTTKGYIPIEKLKVGMEVLTDNGTTQSITKTFERDYFGDMVVIRLDRDTELRFTPNHAIRVLRDGQWKYIESSRIRSGDTLRFPRHVQTDFSFNNEDQAWLIGLIVGDGSVGDKGLSISFHESERDNAIKATRILREWIGQGVISERYRERGAQAISVDASPRIFCEWLRPHIGGKSSEKKLPDFIMRGSDEIRLAGLRGVWAADGSLKNGAGGCHRACFSTISPCLAAQVSELLHGFGIRCSVRRFKRTTNKSNGKIVPIYRVVAYGKDNVNRCRLVLNEQAALSDPVNPYQYIVQEVGIESEWTGKVYNCEVAKDHSYVVAPGFVAHNCCGFSLWRTVTNGLPVVVLGDTPGVSKPAKSVADLVSQYRNSQVFVNTSLISPVPTAVLEAMSCGCAIVSTATCMLPEIIQHGVNGFISNDPAELRSYCELLLKDEALARKLGEQARLTVLSRFSMNRFVRDWDCLLREAANIPYGVHHG